MTAPETSAPQPNFAVAKGIALGLGLLLIAGTALLIVLLVTRDGGASEAGIPALDLKAGERVIDVSLDGDRALFVLEDADNRQRVLLVDSATGTRTEYPLFTIERTVTD
ncbi:MAG: hypothetical protein V2I43_27795 [Parvularcula sp.]|nr:hypothetical protein [Parvularcula sp.]